jgi:hypothetical protein
VAAEQVAVTRQAVVQQEVVQQAGEAAEQVAVTHPLAALPQQDAEQPAAVAAVAAMHRTTVRSTPWCCASLMLAS